MYHFKIFLPFVLMLLFKTVPSVANDSVYYVSGNHLVPTNETRISISKEVLTIDLRDDGYAVVNVEYTMINPDREKTVVMGFEAKAPEFGSFSHNGIHPYISDFEVELNGKDLAYSTSIVYNDTLQEIKGIDNLLTPEQCEEQIGNSMDNCLYDKVNDKMIPFAYAYFFTSSFHHGENYLKHTYRYRLSTGVGYTYYLPYLLTPAMRWANHQIDDFTLQISASATAKHFVLVANAFKGAEFTVISGIGKIRKAIRNTVNVIEVSLRNGAIQWHVNGFIAYEELELYSADYKITNGDMHSRDVAILNGSFYDRSVPQLRYSHDDFTPFQQRILRNLPLASRGYIFSNAEMSEYFNNLWWYMPNPELKDPIIDFTNAEKLAITQK